MMSMVIQDILSDKTYESLKLNSSWRNTMKYSIYPAGCSMSKTDYARLRSFLNRISAKRLEKCTNENAIQRWYNRQCRKANVCPSGFPLVFADEEDIEDLVQEEC